MTDAELAVLEARMIAIPASLALEARAEALARRAQGEALVEIARTYNVSVRDPMRLNCSLILSDVACIIIKHEQRGRLSFGR
jgi:hypothetical protein